MSYRHLLGVFGLALIVVGLIERGWALLAVWAGCDFLVLAVAHHLDAHRIFGKRPDGTLPWWSWLLFLPLFSYTRLVWHLLRIFSPEPARGIVNEQLVIGRRLLASELDVEFANYVDLTAEFVEPRTIRTAPAYRCFPILDGGAPSPEALRAAVSSLRPGRTFIHCAQGHGRTALFALALLLNLGAVSSVEDGLRMLRAARPGVRLSRAQRQCIQAYVRSSLK